MIEFILFALALFGLFGFLLLRSVSKGQKESEANSEQILNRTFNGSQDVTFKINAQSVKYETVIIGAKKRGYKLVHQAENQYGPHTLIFEKVS
ncbi:MAG: hypothetical protein WC829_21255 [Hyphomicrobium sp.]|jgi:hypothetical protein